MKCARCLFSSFLRHLLRLINVSAGIDQGLFGALVFFDFVMRKHIPSLLVADHDALQAHSYAELSDLANEALPVGLQTNEEASSDVFAAKFNVLSVNDTHLLAFSMVGEAKSRGSELPSAYLDVFFSGEYCYQIGQKTIAQKAGRVGGLVAANEKYDTNFYGGVGVSLSFSPESSRLDQVLQSMTGHSGALKGNDGRLDQSRELPLQHGSANLFSSFSQLVRMIQSVEHKPEVMALLALDDALYRHAALMLCPDLFFNEAQLSVPRAGRLDDACDYMRLHLDRSVSLTELESVSGISARSLQYAFQKRFGCTPLQWLSQARLDLARSKLLNPDAETTVTRVALDAGFSNPGNFARKYFERFGELPSQTLSCKAL